MNILKRVLILSCLFLQYCEPPPYQAGHPRAGTTNYYLPVEKQKDSISMQQACFQDQHLPYDLNKAVCDLTLGWYWTEESQYIQALQHLQPALNFFESERDTVGRVAALANMAYLLKTLTGNKQSEDYYQQAVSLLNEQNEEKINHPTWFFLAAVADTLPRAVSFRKAGIQAATQQQDTLFMAKLFHLEGLALLNQRDFTQAVDFIQQSLTWAHTTGDTLLLAKVSATLSTIALQQNDTEKARAYVNFFKTLYGAKPALAVNPHLLEAELEFFKAIGDIRNRQIAEEKIDSAEILLRNDHFLALTNITSRARNQATLQWENQSMEAKLSLQQKQLYMKLAIFGICLCCALVLMVFLSKLLKTNKERQETLNAMLTQFREATRVSRPPDANTQEELQLESAINKLFLEKKIYLEPNLKVGEVAEMLGVGYDTINKYIKNSQKENFNQFVNQFRADHAKAMLSDPELEYLSIEGIALSSGFGSKQQFYNFFQKYTGVKPSEFRKFMQQNPMQQN